jgi:hypothetical protein
MAANAIRRCPLSVRVQAMLPAASYRRMVLVHRPNMDAAMPILTDVVIIPCFIQTAPLNRDIIRTMSNFVQVKMNCLITLRLKAT